MCWFADCVTLLSARCKYKMNRDLVHVKHSLKRMHVTKNIPTSFVSPWPQVSMYHRHHHHQLSEPTGRPDFTGGGDAFLPQNRSLYISCYERL